MLFNLLLFLFLITKDSFAIEIDWAGQYWFENHWLNNYQLDRSRPGFDSDGGMVNHGGTYVPGVGERNIVWYSSFLKLKPKITVTENINIKSEWHIGSPIYGFFGRGYPTDTSNKLDFTGSQKQSMAITAQRFWANFITEYGAVELGRAPTHWGLGAIWNSGDQLFDHYQSTTDTVRITSKFGNFSTTPFYSKVAVGSNVGGAADASGAIIKGSDDVSDYGVHVKYENNDDGIDLGLMWNHRAGDFAQNSLLYNNLGAGGTNQGSRRVGYNVFDLYAKKVTGRYTFGLELPYFRGRLGALDGAKEFDYNSYAIILETKYSSDRWDIDLKAGHVPGQPNGNETPAQQSGYLAVEAGQTTYRPVYLNKNYGLGLIMFHYNIYGLSNNNPDTVAAASLNSPYDSPIVNANYLAFAPSLKLDKWTMKWTIVTGWADQTAERGKIFYNHQQRRWYSAFNQKESDQSSFLGKEFDYTLSFKWDENFLVSWDMGMWFPGAYYEFTNLDTQKTMDVRMMWASQLRMGVTF